MRVHFILRLSLSQMVCSHTQLFVPIQRQHLRKYGQILTFPIVDFRL